MYIILEVMYLLEALLHTIEFKEIQEDMEEDFLLTVVLLVEDMVVAEDVMDKN